MSKNEDLLRQAFEELAREETEQLENSLTRTEIRRAEEMYQRHRGRALSLIRRGTGAPKLFIRFAAIAAAAAVIVGAAVLSLGHTPPDHVPAAQPPTVSVVPYYSPEPSPSETAAVSALTPEPTVVPTEKWEYIATYEHTLQENDTKNATEEIINPIIIPAIPTFTDEPTAKPTPAATVAPTESPLPTAAPTDTPAPLPAEEIAPEAGLQLPREWQGAYFPYGLPAGGLAVLSDGDGWQRIAWHADGGLWVFTEYEENDVIDVPEGAIVSYTQWDGIVALRMEDDTGVTLAWVQDGHSFSLCTDAENAEAVAQSVRKTEP